MAVIYYYQATVATPTGPDVILPRPRLNDTLTLPIIRPPSTQNAKSRPIRQMPRFLLRPLHGVERRHRIRVLVGHERGGSLFRNQPLINQDPCCTMDL